MKFKLLFVLSLMLVSMKIQAENSTTIEVTFSAFQAGKQYAEDEKHDLGDGLVIYTTLCHFTSELRIYSSTSNNGFVVSEPLPGTIIGMSFSMGYEKDVLNVYGSTDKENWTLIEGIDVSSTSYKNYSLDFPTEKGYTCFKLDVAGENQIRIKSMSVTYVSDGNDNENEGSSGDIEEEIVISAPTFNPGSTTFSTESLDVTISAAEGYDVYYTTDGTTPSYTDAETFVGTKGKAVTIAAGDSKVNLQAIAVNPTTGKCSEVSSATYTYAPIVNEGTEANPFTVTEVKSMKANKQDKWVRGIIYGTMVNSSDFNQGLVTSGFSSKSNIVIGDDEVQIPIQLLSDSKIRNDINLVDHSYLVGKEILIKGTLTKYCGSWGVTEPSAYKIIHDVPINSYGYATLFLDMPVSVPQSSNVYYCITKGNVVELLSVPGRVVPANVGVIIKSSPNTTCKLSYTAEINPYEKNIRENNQLIGYTQDTDITDSDNAYYALNAKDSKVGFYIPKTINGDGSFTAKTGKAYLKVPVESQATMYLLPHGNDETIVVPITHYSDEVIYDLQGRVVSSPTAGVYIKAGKKFIIK